MTTDYEPMPSHLPLSVESGYWKEVAQGKVEDRLPPINFIPELSVTSVAIFSKDEGVLRNILISEIEIFGYRCGNNSLTELEYCCWCYLSYKTKSTTSERNKASKNCFRDKLSRSSKGSTSALLVKE